MTSPIIFGLSDLQLNNWERGFFREVKPAGYILFKRNCQMPPQIQALTDSLRELAGDAEIPILIDQEGGRVMRLQPPHWPALPCMGWFGTLYDRAPTMAEASLVQACQVIAETLLTSGINTVCAPCLDIPSPGADNIIGDRAFHTDPQIVAHLGNIAMQAFTEHGVRPIIKHIPGHGRAAVDSHLALPVVDAELATLEQTDFLPFRILNNATWAMLAHITYTALDNEVATYSAKTVRYIRETIGFTGTLLSDDLSMHALQGDFAARARRTLAAGVDLLLHCNGDPTEMQACLQGI